MEEATVKTVPTDGAIMEEATVETVPGWLWLGDKSWLEDETSAARHGLTHRLQCTMNEADSSKWMSTWSCDCGLCPGGDSIGNALGLLDDNLADDSLVCLPVVKPARAQYHFASWASTIGEQTVTVGYLPLFDDDPFCRHHAEPLLRAGSDFIAAAKSECGRVYVHCEKGCSRSVAVVACYLMRYENMSLLEAAVMLKGRRARASPNGALVDILAKIENTLCAKPSDVREVLAAFQKPWLQEYRAGKVKLNNVDLIF